MRTSFSLRSLLLAAAGLALGSAAAMGCAAERSAASVAEGEEDLTDLRSRTRLDAAVTVDGEGEATVRYEASPYPESGVKFEAVKFATDADQEIEVAVAGDFPGRATVVVTDADFNVLGSARTEREEGSETGSAMVRVPAGAGDHLVLVRDQKWVKPMTFGVKITGSAQR